MYIQSIEGFKEDPISVLNKVYFDSKDKWLLDPSRTTLFKNLVEVNDKDYILLVKITKPSLIKDYITPNPDTKDTYTINHMYDILFRIECNKEYSLYSNDKLLCTVSSDQILGYYDLSKNINILRFMLFDTITIKTEGKITGLYIGFIDVELQGQMHKMKYLKTANFHYNFGTLSTK